MKIIQGFVMTMRPLAGRALATGFSFLFTSLLAQAAWADGLSVSVGSGPLPQVSIVSTVPVVNIVAPDAAGLSHNRFVDFNIPTQGLVLNNSTAGGNSVLAGSLAANPLLAGRSATLILNEVTGFNPSRLLGRAEVFGPAASVVIANPNGVYSNGAGFINTPRVTLTTGTPVFSGGLLDGFAVNQGSIRLEGTALDAREVAQLDLVARQIVLDGALVTQGDARLAAGQGVWRYAGAAFSSGAPAGAGALAIDATHLGAMSAGRIFIVANEAGAGVRLDGALTATADDVAISADGEVILRDLHANGRLDLVTTGAATLNGRALAGGDAVLTAGRLEVTGALASAGNLAVTLAGDADLAGDLAAGQALTLQADGGVTLGGGGLCRQRPDAARRPPRCDRWPAVRGAGSGHRRR